MNIYKSRIAELEQQLLDQKIIIQNYKDGKYDLEMIITELSAALQKTVKRLEKMEEGK